MKVLILYNESMRRYVIEYVNSLCVHPDIVSKKIDETTLLPTLNCKIIIVNWFHISEYGKMISLNLKHHNFNPNELDIGIVNLEQLSREYLVPQYLSVCANLKSTYPLLQLYDYSNGNIQIIANHGYQAKLLDYQFNREEVDKLKRFNSVPKETDVIMIGTNPTYEHRMNIYNTLKDRGVNIKFFTNLWDDDRDREIAKSRILLNVHYLPNYQLFETLRCNRWIFANKLVVTETSKANEQYYLNKYMITAPHDKLADTVIEVLRSYGDYEFNFNMSDADKSRSELLATLGILI